MRFEDSFYFFNPYETNKLPQNLFLERGQPVPPNLIVADSRIGVEYAGEIWGYKELRFSIMHDPYVSIKPKISPKGS